MKRILLFFILCMSSFSLGAVISPESLSIGKIAVDAEENSVEERVIAAMKTSYDDEWLETYASAPLPFAAAYSASLSPLLPLEDYLVSVYDGNEIKVLDRKSGKIITVIIEDGLFAALRIE